MIEIPDFDLPTGPLPDLPEVPEHPQWITRAWQRLPREERAKLGPLPVGEPFTFPEDCPPEEAAGTSGEK